MALRTATGCLRKTDIGHLHTECKLLKVEQHNVLLAKQFYLATKQTNHANFSIPFTPPPRIMKPSLATKYEDSISHLFTDNVNSSAQHKIGLNTLHTEAVAASIAQAPPNKVILRAAPEVNAEEKKLPRSSRVTLAQLRSNYSTKLMSTLHCFNPDTYNPECPKCGDEPHDTNHLFNCPVDPTTLTTLDLWSNPVAAATFLGLGTADEPGDGRQGDPG